MFDDRKPTPYLTDMKLFAVLAMLIAAAQGFAADEERITEVLAQASRTMDDKVATLFAEQQKQIDARCPLGPLEPEHIYVMEEPRFNLDGIPERGKWVVRYLTTACGDEVRRTAFFEALDEGVAVEAAAPGDTMADPSLEKDIWASFQKAAVRSAPECREMVLMDTRISEPPRTTSNGNWREVWFGNICGQIMQQTVALYPSKAGTMFRMILPKPPIGDGRESRIDVR